jgi:hypothetical protein
MKSNVKPKITVKILKQEKGYDATAKIGEKFIATCGDTFKELKEKILDAVNLAFEDEGFVFTIEEIDIV